MDQLALLGAAMLGLLGGYLLFYAYRSIRRARASQSWPSTTGKVISSWIEEVSGSDQVLYYPKITYSYSVMGRDYESSLISFGGRGGIERKARSLIRQHPKESSVTVYYNPENPMDAVLNKDAPTSLWVILAGLFFLGLAIVIARSQLT